VVAAVALTAALAVAALAFPEHAAAALDAYVLALGAVAAAAVVTRTRALRHRGASPIDRPLPGAAPGTGRTAELDRIERLVVLSANSSFDVHYRLRPLLRELAASRLAARGIDLDRSPEAELVLGDDLWNVVRPDLELGNRAAPGMPVEAAERLVDALERV
jgi:hypothetical protein